jgi:hypothetical protein
MRCSTVYTHAVLILYFVGGEVERVEVVDLIRCEAKGRGESEEEVHQQHRGVRLEEKRAEVNLGI